jgi:hypothetical protein
MCCIWRYKENGLNINCMGRNREMDCMEVAYRDPEKNRLYIFVAYEQTEKKDSTESVHRVREKWTEYMHLIVPVS